MIVWSVDMLKFYVTWWVTFFDHDPEIHYTVKEEFEAESLDNLFDILDEGIEEDKFCPEDRIENSFELGNLNLEYALITDESGKESYRDSDFKDALIPEENKL